MRDMEFVWVVELELYDKKVYHKKFKSKESAWKAYNNLPREDKNYIITIQRKWRERNVA